MAQYDGSIKIDTKLDSEGLISDLKNLGKLLEGNISQIVESLSNLAATTISDATSQMNDVKEAAKSIGKELTVSADCAEKFAEKQDKISGNTEKLSKTVSDAAGSIGQFNESGNSAQKTLQLVGSATDSVKLRLDLVCAAVMSAIDKMQNFGKVGEYFGKGIKSIQNTIDSLSDKIKNKANTVFESAADTIKKLTTSSMELVDKGLNKIQSAIQIVKSRLEPLISTFNKTKVRIEELINAGKSLADTGFNKINSGVERVKSKFDNIINTFNKVKIKIQEISNAGKNLADSGLNKIRSGIDKVKSKFTPAITTFNNAKEKIENFGKAGKELADKVLNKLKSAVESIKEKFKKLGDEEEKSTEKTNTFGDTLKAILSADVIKAGLNAVWSGVKRIGQSFIELGKQSIEAYANREQLVGGVETLFKNNAETVQKYAVNAYKTAGLSANQYMETVTGFSASLLQSLGGNTAKAAKIADVTISDMSDNANKMGTDMQAIQDAYQGFAKQNYTMLDNLKLGYGGTKSEMERLIADANKLNAQQGKHTKYSIKNYSDIISAIHDIQVNMGIYGTTSKEAMSTIQGSLNMTKAAWQNLLVGMADDNANFDELINNLVESVTAAFHNILPRIGTVISGIGKLIEGLAPVIVERLPEVINEAGPGIINAAKTLVLVLFNALKTTLSEVDWYELGTTVSDSINGIDWVSLFGEAAKMISDMLVQELDVLLGFAENLDWEKLGEDLWNSIVAVITNIDWNAVISKAFELLGAAIGGAAALIEGLAKAAWDSLKAGFEATKDYFGQYIEDAGGNIIEGIFNGITDAIKNIDKWIEDHIFQPFIDGFKNAFGIHSPSTVMEEQGSYIIDGFINGIKALPTKVLEKFDKLKMKIKSWGNNLKSSIKNIGGNLVTGMWNGINDKVGWITDKIKGFGDTVINKIKSIFGVHSPSTVTKEIGGYLADGFGIGFNKTIPKIQSGMLNNIRAMTEKMRAVVSFESGKIAANTSGRGNVTNSTVNYNTTNNQKLEFNQPIQTPAQVARAARKALEVT